MTNPNWVKFFGNNDYHRDDGTFNGPCAKYYGLHSDIDSLQTSANGWLIIFSEENYSGHWQKFPENSGSNKDDPAHDLNKIDCGDDTWKGNVKSFVLYGNRKYYDEFGGGTPPVPNVEDQPTFCMFSDRPYISGSWGFLETGYSYKDTQDDLTVLPNSFAAGTGIWLTLYDQTNFGLDDDGNFSGSTLRVEAGDKIGDTSAKLRGTTGNWYNHALSIRTSSHRPESWSLGFDESAFQSQYSDPSGSLAGPGTSFTYQTQDAQYRLYCPLLDWPDHDTYQLTQSIDYIVSMATDVHVELTCTFDKNGKFVSAGGSWTSSETYAVPDWLVKTVDAVVEVAGALGAIETLGISEEAAEFAIGVFDTACKAFDTFASAVSRHSLDDGGQYYLVPMCCHTIVRLAAAQTYDTAALYPDPAKKTLSFSADGFSRAIADTAGMAITSGTSGSGATWLQWSGTSGALNTYFEYTHDDDNWRSWHPEVTTFPTGVGMLVSCKVDYVRGAEDDHILILVGFLMDNSLKPKACFAQASVQFGGEDDMDIVGDPITSGDVAQGVADSLTTIINGDDFGDFFASTDGRKTIPTLAKDNINAIIAAVASA